MYLGSLPAASNRAQYILTLQIIDEETGEGIDLSDYTITFAVREKHSQSDVLTATNDDGIDVVDADDGTLVLTFTSTQMRTLCAKQYDVGCTITPAGGDTDQYIIGTLPVLDGVVS